MDLFVFVPLTHHGEPVVRVGGRLVVLVLAAEGHAGEVPSSNPTWSMTGVIVPSTSSILTVATSIPSVTWCAGAALSWVKSWTAQPYNFADARLRALDSTPHALPADE